jgi:hypothetical protein
VIASVKGDGYLRPLQILEGSGADHPLQILEGSGADRHDLPGCKLLLSLGLIRVGSAEDVVDLRASGKSLFGSFVFFSCSTFFADLRILSMKPYNLLQF